MPIVLHLIMRRKPKLLEFPALRFIQKRHDTNQRRLRLRHLLLLLLRMAVDRLLAFALARPSMQVPAAASLGSQEAPVAAALVFDAAPHMDYRHENKTRLEVAQRMGPVAAAGIAPGKPDRRVRHAAWAAAGSTPIAAWPSSASSGWRR